MFWQLGCAHNPWHQVCEGSEGATRLATDGARGSLQKILRHQQWKNIMVDSLLIKKKLFTMEA